MSIPAGGGPLAGVLVLDLTQALAGPYCTMLLADLGAEVIKIEPPAGDMTRFAGPFTKEDTERAYGGYFASINRNKRSVVLDLKQPGDRDLFLGMAQRADVVVENARVGVMDRLGVGYEVLSAANPRLVYGAIRGFGDPRTGSSPYVDWPAFDVVAQAMGGLVSMTGTAGGQVLRCGASIGDLYPAVLAALGVVAALRHAAVTGVGQFVDVAMYDAVLSLCEAIAWRYSYTGQVTVPTGNGHPLLSPFDIFPTADGACAIAAPTDSHWPVLCALIGRPDLATDDRFATNDGRVAHRDQVTAAVTGWAQCRSSAEVVSTLAGKVPVGPVQTALEIFADPHVTARDMLITLDQPDGTRPVTVAGSPIKLTVTPTVTPRRPPRLGEHTTEVLAELGVVPEKEAR